MGRDEVSVAKRSFVSAVRWSSGNEAPHFNVPPNATDCHHHIYDSRFAADPKAEVRPADASIDDYKLLQQRLGISRNVVVHPSTYGVDNRALIDALQKFGRQSTRGIAVVNTSVSDAELQQLHAVGVRGVRFNLRQKGATTWEMLEPMAQRLTRLNWHVQVNVSAVDIVAARELWQRLSLPDRLRSPSAHAATGGNRRIRLLPSSRSCFARGKHG